MSGDESRTCPYCGWPFKPTERHRTERVLPFCSHGCRLALAGSSSERAPPGVSACAAGAPQPTADGDPVRQDAAALAALLACTIPEAQAAIQGYSHALVMCAGKPRKMALLGAVIAAGGDLRRPNCRKIATALHCPASSLRRLLAELSAHPVLGVVLLRRHRHG